MPGGRTLRTSGGERGEGFHISNNKDVTEILNYVQQKVIEGQVLS